MIIKLDRNIYSEKLLFLQTGDSLLEVGTMWFLPQYVLAKIRKLYPDSNGKYVGFSDSVDIL